MAFHLVSSGHAECSSGAPGAGAAVARVLILRFLHGTGEQVQAMKDVFASTSKFKIGFAVHVFCLINLISIYFGILVTFDP